MRVTLKATLAAAAVISSATFASGASASAPVPLYGFCQKTACKDGQNPNFPLTFDSDGNLFGAMQFGSNKESIGNLFELSANGDGTFTQKVLWRFCPTSAARCAKPSDPRGRVAVDPNGNVFGVTFKGDGTEANGGVVYELPKTGKIKVLAKLCAKCSPALVVHGGSGGMSWAGAEHGVPWDGKSPLYFTTIRTIDETGSVYALTKSKHKFKLVEVAQAHDPNAVVVSDSGTVFFTVGDDIHGDLYKLGTSNPLWHFCAPHTACNEGSNPQSLMVDRMGNLYGTTAKDSKNNKGALWKLAAPAYTKMTTVLAFCKDKSCADGNGGGPLQGMMSADATGNVFGTLASGGGSANPAGVIFKIGTDGSYTKLYGFSCNGADCPLGGLPVGVTIDEAGNLYGNAFVGGPTNAGMSYRFTP